MLVRVIASVKRRFDNGKSYEFMTDKPDHPRKHERITRDLGRLAACAAGAAIGIGFALWAVDMPSSHFFLASLGGSAVFLFGLTRAAAAQPRALLGGHLGGAVIGVL